MSQASSQLDLDLEQIGSKGYFGLHMYSSSLHMLQHKEE